MALEAYIDEACTVKLQGIQICGIADATDPGVNKVYGLDKFTGAELGSIYLWSGGVYTKLIPASDYNLAGNTVTLVEALQAAEYLYLIPVNALNLNIGGTPGSTGYKTAKIWLKRTAGYVYDDILLYYKDTNASTTYESAANATATLFEGYCTITGFSDLSPGSLIGCAVAIDGIYIGQVTGNTMTDVTTDNTTFTGSGRATVVTVGVGTVSLDGVAFSPILGLLPVNDDTPIPLWVKCALVIPPQAANYPNYALVVENTEFLE